MNEPSSKIRPVEDNQNITSDTLDAINIYFKLKQKYENEQQKKKHKIINRDDLNYAEKRDLYQTLKPKCIICKQPGGSIFKVEKNRYLAMCNASPKCKFDIRITKGKVFMLDKYVKELQQQHSELVTTIMKTKYNLLFNYLNEAETVTVFEKNKADFDMTTSSFNLYKSKFIEITNLLSKNDIINLTELQIFEFVKEIKQLVADAKLEEEPQYLKEAVELYINRLMSALTTNRKNKYSYQDVEMDEDGNHKLVQKPVTIYDLEILVGNPYKVEALVIKK